MAWMLLSLLMNLRMARKLLLAQMLPMSLMLVDLGHQRAFEQALNLHLDQYLHLDVLLLKRGKLLIQPRLLAFERVRMLDQVFDLTGTIPCLRQFNHSVNASIYNASNQPQFIRFKMVRHTSSCFIRCGVCWLCSSTWLCLSLCCLPVLHPYRYQFPICYLG